MTTGPNSNVVVVGAGPAGCVSALAFARKGAQVDLLEAQPDNKRLAGEWLHPPGVEILRNLGVPPIPAAANHLSGRGFVVYPEDSSEPIVLRYPAGQQGMTCEHHALVTALRETATRDPRIRFHPWKRVTHLSELRTSKFHDPHSSFQIPHSLPALSKNRMRNEERGIRNSISLTCASSLDGSASTYSPDLVVGADGRSSVTRRFLGIPDQRTLLSHMAGIVLEDVDLPFEGFGHVFLGGPGPMLFLRIGPDHVRACIDVPVNSGRPLKTGEALFQAYHGVLPSSLHAGFRKALEQPIVWAANQWRPRVHYGREGLALVGDAIGHFHPLTALGMTLGFMDAYSLAECGSVREYRNQRAAASRVPELLSMGMHNLFTLQDAGTVALRQAVFKMWRQSPTDCQATMRLLSGQSTSLDHFARSFLKVVALGLQQVAKDMLGSWHWRRLADSLKSFAQWLGWLAAGALAPEGATR